MEEKLNCYDVYVESEDYDEDFEFLIWAKSSVLAKARIITELRLLDVSYNKIRVQKVKIYDGKILHLN